eukprot:11901917-Ditylum_brightwellii.AAC.1
MYGGMSEQDIDIWGWSKTNIKWTPNTVSQAKYMGNQIYNNFTFVASSSDDPAGFSQQGGCGQHQVTIVTSYCPCKQSDPGDSTVAEQQCQIFRTQGANKPKPRTQWIKDIKSLLQQ